MAAFVTSQMHLLQAVVILVALCIWAGACLRERPAMHGWLAIAVLQVVAFLIKEDGVSVWPAVILLHAVHRRFVTPRVAPVPRWVLALGALELALLVGLRQWALQGFGGYAVAGLSEAAANLMRGPRRVLLLRDVASYQGYWIILVLTAALTVVGGLATWGSADRLRRSPLLIGLTLIVAFNVTFALASKSEQWYMLAIGVAMVLAASCDALLVDRRSTARWVAASLVLLEIAGLGTLTRTHNVRFDPYSERSLQLDLEVLRWPEVSFEIREFLAIKRDSRGAARQAATVEQLPIVTFGLSDPSPNEGTLPVRQLCGRAEVLVPSGWSGLALELHTVSATSSSVAVTIEPGARARSISVGPTWVPVEWELPSALHYGRHRRVRLLAAEGCVEIRSLQVSS
jgi:hypothetical protein